MASKHINITDFKSQIPGKITSNKLRYQFPDVISTNSRNQRKLWNIYIELIQNKQIITIKDKYYDELPNDIHAYIYTSNQQLDYADKNRKPSEPTIAKPSIIKKGKNIGKSNETNAFTQALRDALSKYNKKLDNASQKTTNNNSLIQVKPKPMLALDFNKNNEPLNYPVIIQPKLDGVRTVIYFDNTNQQIHKYSRTAKEYTLQYLDEELIKIFTDKKLKLPNNIHLDGELYLHNTPLQTIGSMAKKPEKYNNKLEYHCFDLFIPNNNKKTGTLPYSERCEIFDRITDYYANEDTNFIKFVDTRSAANWDEIEEFYEECLNNKYEGAMIRRMDRLYHYGPYRGNSLMKLKPFFDSEFKCVGFTQGEYGKDVGAIIWICETDQGKTFNVRPGNNTNYEKRYELFTQMSIIEDNGKTYFDNNCKDKLLTVRYDDLSEDGIPLRARAIAFRDYE